MGTSPRVRSGLGQADGLIVGGGIISACAERTRPATRAGFSARDYLRVCGADETSSANLPSHAGLSPRVRSGHAQGHKGHAVRGIISACAERTPAPCSRASRDWDYLRVCGADNEQQGNALIQAGLSPRVRSGLVGRVPGVVAAGIISACAERTVVFYCGLSRSGDMEYLIRALRGVGKRRGYQYLE